MEKRLMTADEVSARAIVELLHKADLSAEVDVDGEVKISTDFGTHTYIVVDQDRSLLKFYTAFRLRRNAPRLSKLTLANTMNDKVIFARFSVVGEDILFSDYFLSYRDGLLPEQLLRSLNWFNQACMGAIAEYDVDDIVQ